MIKILTTGYSPCIQGSYGIVTRELFTRIFNTGRYDIVSHGWFHAEISDQVPWRVINTNIITHPDGRKEIDPADKFGEVSFSKAMVEVKPDIVWAIGDQYMLRHICQFKKIYPNTLFVLYLAVDGEPWHLGLTQPYNDADYVFALSRYGANTLAPLLRKPIEYIYHGVNLNTFFPLPDEDKKAARLKISPLLTDDTFLIGWVGRNQFRKQVWKLWEYMHYIVHGDYIICNSCKKVTLKEYDKSKGLSRDIDELRMYTPGYDYSTCWHCKSADITLGKPRTNVYSYYHMPPHMGEGWDPNQLGDLWRVRKYFLNTEGINNNKGLPTNDMNRIYNSFDLFYCMTGGEGFGIPVLESMTCRVPVMFTNYSSHPEIVADSGIPVTVDWMCEMNSCYDRALANTADAIAKSLPYIEDKSKLIPLGDKAFEIAKGITWDSVSQEWIKALDEISQKVKHSLGRII